MQPIMLTIQIHVDEIRTTACICINTIGPYNILTVTG